MKNKEFYNLKSDGYDILFHAPSSKFTKVDKNLELDSMSDEEIYKLTNLEKKPPSVESEITYGKGKIGVTFMSSRTCNLNCRYCFAGEGEYGAKEDKPKYMTAEIYMNSIKLVVENMYPEGIKSICFFGGEPLLNYQEIKTFVAQCREYFQQKKLDMPSLAVSTNGILLNEEILSFLKEYNFQIGLSIDGIKEINDAARLSLENNFSVYDTVLKNVALINKYNLKYAFQMTINKNHLRQYRKGIVKEWMKETKVFENANVSIVPVTSDDLLLGINSEEDLALLDELTRELFNYYLNELFNDESKAVATGIIAPLILLAKDKLHGSCSAGHSIFVDTDGGIYPCHMFCNDDEFLLGNIKEKSIDVDNINRNLNIKRYDGEQCRTCIAQNVCSVWCKGIQYLTNGDMQSVLDARCIFQRAIVEESIRTLAKLADKKLDSKVMLKNYSKIAKLVK